MARETQVQRQERVLETINLLERHYPDAHCALHHTNAEELLIATVLSAQCTDERVNKVTPALFKQYPTLQKLAVAPLSEIERLIGSINFFRNKAKALKGLAERLTQEHGGKVPRDLDYLVTLPGVGRKTANVVMGNAFNEATGVVVDTHVLRLSRRLGFTTKKTPVDVEEDLMKQVPKEKWVMISHLLIFHGRQVCGARKPLCATCFLADICPQKMG